MRKKLTLSKNVDKDVVLCQTTYFVVSKRTTSLLLSESVPFFCYWKRVPLLKRNSYNGADKICVFTTNRNNYIKARHVLSGGLAPKDYARLQLNYL